MFVEVRREGAVPMSCRRQVRAQVVGDRRWEGNCWARRIIPYVILLVLRWYEAGVWDYRSSIRAWSG